MQASRTSTGLGLVVALAFLGFLLWYVPGELVDRYAVISRTGPSWLLYAYLAAVSTGGVLLLGSTLWILIRLWLRTRKKERRRTERDKRPSELSEAEREQQLLENLSQVEQLKGDVDLGEEVRWELDPLADRIEEKRSQQKLEIVAFGAISSGKSALLNALAGRDVFATDPRGGTTIQRNEIPWPGIDRVLLVDTPGLGEIDGAEHVHLSTEAAKDADLVLVVVDGPLRDWEFRLLERLAQQEKRILVCLNKSDWYDERQKPTLMSQITEQVRAFVSPEDVLTVRAQPARRKRIRVLADGREVEEEVDVAPDITPLAQRMMDVIRRDGRDLLLANLLLQSRGLVEEARARVRESLDRRAWQLVDRYMWAAGGAAALSPLPMLDLVAGSAVTAKMVLDLARVYRQEMDLNTAVTLLGQLGKNLLGILGVSAATPIVVSSVASLLKTVPGAGTIAGGAMQGLVQALITRWIGAVFIRYYKHEMQLPEGGLAAVARKEWERITSITELRKLVMQARSRLMSEE